MLGISSDRQISNQSSHSKVFSSAFNLTARDSVSPSSSLFLFSVIPFVCLLSFSSLFLEGFFPNMLVNRRRLAAIESRQDILYVDLRTSEHLLGGCSLFPLFWIFFTGFECREQTEAAIQQRRGSESYPRILSSDSW